jgi:hypothetical protein
VELAADLAQQRPALVGEGRREAGCGVERVGDLQELGGLETPAADRALGPRSDVVARADPDPGTVAQERPSLVRLVEGAGDEDRVRLRLQRVGQPARRRERGQLRESLADLRELEEDERALVHQRVVAGRRGPEMDGDAASISRHGCRAHGSPA